MTKCSLKTRIFYQALMKTVHCTVITIKKKKCSRMEIGISRVYNVLMVLKWRKSEKGEPILCTWYFIITISLEIMLFLTVVACEIGRNGYFAGTDQRTGSGCLLGIMGNLSYK